ncbi:hypothetical protein ACP4OV_022858 [Aristida adscensionis]
MGKKKESQRDRRRRSKTARDNDDARVTRTRATPTSIRDLSDDLLELVLLRTASPVSLVRAAAVCKPWRRVIAGGGGFLRRFRSLRGPHVLGHYHVESSGKIAFVPSPAPPRESAAAADDDDTDDDDTRGGGRASLDFLLHKLLPGPMSPALTDSRGGLLLFVHMNYTIIVCEPWRKQYRELDLPPRPPWMNGGYSVSECLGAFLLDADAGIPSFRVLYVRLHRTVGDPSHTVSAFVVSASGGGGGGRWHLLSSKTIVAGDVAVVPMIFEYVGRAGGLLCWSVRGHGNGVPLLQLDERTGEFSSFVLPMAAAATSNPRTYTRQNLRVVGADDAGVLRLCRVVGDDLEVLRCARGGGGGGGGSCAVERRVALSRLIGAWPGWRRWWFLDTAAATPARLVLTSNAENNMMFIVDVETMELECARERERHASRVFPYELPWPPTIEACTM